MEIIAAGSLIQLANHFKGTQVLSRPQPKVREVEGSLLDLIDIKVSVMVAPPAISAADPG